MADKYTVKHVAALNNVAEETVRLWAQEFKRHLSPNANPGSRRQRFFSDEDMKVLDLIATMKDEGKTFADVHVALDAGERGTRPEAPPDELQALIVSQDEQKLVELNEELRQRVLSLQAEIRRLQEMEKDNIRLTTKLESMSERAERAEEHVKELLEERGKLREELGELRGEMRFLLRQVGSEDGDD